MRKWLLATVAAAVAILAFAATASGDVPRYQPTATLTVSLTGIPGNVHTFTIAWTDPCGATGAFTGTGHGSPVAGGAGETITGTFAGGALTFKATYVTFIPGYSWTYQGPLSGTTIHDSFGGSYAAAATLQTINTYRNHGDYVSSMGGGADAAHSCVGMPIGK